jgi:phosphocarrier protein HPr
MPSSEPGAWMSRRVTITGKLGLHARPAARFVKLAQTFDAEVEVANRAGRVSAGSIMGLMMLAASTGSEVEISARGPQAAEALAALAQFVADGFGDD